MDDDGNILLPGQVGTIYSYNPGREAVFGIPNDEWGEEVKAVVEPARGVKAGPELTAELMAYVSGRVAKFKLPRSINFLEALPRDPYGKRYNRKLREPYWAGRKRAI